MGLQNLFLRAGNEVLSAYAQLPFAKKQLNKKLKSELSQTGNDVLIEAFNLYFNIENAIYSSAEKCFGLIEDERKKLLADNTEIVRKDFGAGSKNSSKNKSIKVGSLCKSASTPKKYASLLYSIIRAQKPAVCIELGTCLGISAAYQAHALKVNNSGKLISVEGDPASAEIAKKTLQNLHIYSIAEILTGKFSDVLPQLISNEKKIDFAFIDGHHSGNATLDYYELLKPSLTKKSILIFDDIDWSDDMQHAWKMLCSFNENTACINLGRLGLCVYDPESKASKKIFTLNI